MSLSLIESPARELPTGVLSRWVSVADSPVMFRFQYSSDNTYNALTYEIVSEQLIITLDSDIGTALQIGDFIRITDGFDFYYPAITKVETVNSPSVTKLTTNFTQNYGFEQEVNQWFQSDYYVTVLINVEGEFIQSVKLYPFKDGRINFNVAQYLLIQLKNIEEYTFDNQNSKDLNASKQFKLVYTEFFRGQTTSCEETDVFHATNSANQILDAYDSNRGLFVPSILPVSPEEVLKGKWLSKFDSPKIWDGYPFSLSFIFPQDIGEAQLQIGNGTPIELDDNQRGYINRFSIDPTEITDTNTGDCVTLSGESLIGDCFKITEGGGFKLLEGTGKKLLESCSDVASLPNIQNSVTNEVGGICDLNFPLDVNFIIVYDTTSFSIPQSEIFKNDYIDRYIDELRQLYPKWNGSVSQYSIGSLAKIQGVEILINGQHNAYSERWLTWANIAPSIGQDKSILICLIDESNNDYIIDPLSDPAVFTDQPTATYTSDYNDFVNSVYPAYKYLKSIVYSVPAGSLDTYYANQQMHVYAAVQGTTVSASDFVPSFQGDITLIQSQNPYSSLGKGLKDYNWSERHSFETSISSLPYNDFRDDMDEFIFNQ
jgi:hypothetical protein